MDHKIGMGTTVRDDGVWLMCSCGWMKHLGHGSAPEDAVCVANAHRAMPTDPGDEKEWE